MYLYGASGHAKVIIEILEESGVHVSGLFDDNPAVKNLLDYKSLGQYQGQLMDDTFIISIGDNKLRHRIASKFKVNYGKAISISASISNRTSIGDGTVIMRNVSVNSDVKIGMHVIINTSASIDHDCVIEDFVHISPNATLCGGVSIGEGTHVGAASVIIPGIKIGRWATIGAGAVIIHDVPDFAVVVGNPGRVIKYMPVDERPVFLGGY